MHIKEHEHKASLCNDINAIKQLDLYMGKLTLEMIHMGSIQVFIETRQQQGVKTRTINYVGWLVSLAIYFITLSFNDLDPIY